MTMKRYDRFFTSWALVSHMLFRLGLFYNTYLLALFVFVGSLLINMSFNEQYDLGIDLIGHYLPLLLFWNEPKIYDVRPLLIMLPMYLLYMRFDMRVIARYYKRPVDALCLPSQ